MSILFGYLFEWEGFNPEEGGRRSASFQEAILKLEVFRFIRDRAVPGAPKWSLYHFLSPRPLWGEEPHSLELETPYHYTIYVRVNEITQTVIIAGPRFGITEEAVRTFNGFHKPGLHRRVINIDQMADYLLEPGAEKRFAVTYLLADVPGYGSALSSMSLIGDDIAAADFMVEERGKLTARQLGVRSIFSRIECGRFGSLGSIRFRPACISDFESFLSYAYQNNFYIS